MLDLSDMPRSWHRLWCCGCCRTLSAQTISAHALETKTRCTLSPKARRARRATLHVHSAAARVAVPCYTCSLALVILRHSSSLCTPRLRQPIHNSYEQRRRSHPLRAWYIYRLLSDSCSQIASDLVTTGKPWQLFEAMVLRLFVPPGMF
jgi:hypothetical protein